MSVERYPLQLQPRNRAQRGRVTVSLQADVGLRPPYSFKLAGAGCANSQASS